MRPRGLCRTLFRRPHFLGPKIPFIDPPDPVLPDQGDGDIYEGDEGNGDGEREGLADGGQDYARDMPQTASTMRPAPASAGKICGEIDTTGGFCFFDDKIDRIGF